MALRIIEQGLLIQAPIPSIWDTVVNVNKWNSWNPLVRRVELLETPKVDAMGTVYGYTGSASLFRITAFTPHETLQWSRPFILETDLIQSFMITKNAEGAILTATLDCDGKMGGVARFLMRKSLTIELKKQLLGLKAFCEARDGRGHEGAMRLAG